MSRESFYILKSRTKEQKQKEVRVSRYAARSFSEGDGPALVPENEQKAAMHAVSCQQEGQQGDLPLKISDAV